MAHKIDEKECIKCGICVSKCPEGAITEVVEYVEGLEIHNTSIDPDKCNDCGICVQRCNFGARKLLNNKLNFFKDYCFGCGMCVSECPEKAISLKKP